MGPSQEEGLPEARRLYIFSIRESVLTPKGPIYSTLAKSMT